MYKAILTAFSAAALLAACNTAADAEATDNSVYNTLPQVQQPSTTTADSTISLPAVQTASLPNGPVVTAPVAKTATASAPASNTASAGLNPAHGQPGHRCELPVGAPLNGSAQTAVQPKVVTSPAVTGVAKPVPNPAAASVPTPAGTNPQHGQPGHRCDIPVGAPLNTPAAAPVIEAKQETKKDSSR